MNFEKTDLVDVFTVILEFPVSVNLLPYQYVYKFPIIQNRQDIKFFKITNLSICYDEGNTVIDDGIYLIKSDIVSNSDRVITAFALYESNLSVNESINVERSHILKCATPLGGSANFWLEGTKNTMSFAGSISFTLECYR